MPVFKSFYGFGIRMIELLILMKLSMSSARGITQKSIQFAAPEKIQKICMRVLKSKPKKG